MNISKLINLTYEDMKKVDAFSLNNMQCHIPMIDEINDYLFSANGKRLRPMLTLAASRCCNYQGSHHITLATAIEFLHTATLLHDDVVDESDMRRGKKTARLLWGNQATVLVGDFLLGQAFKMMVNVDNIEALKLISNASSIIAQGEVMQLAAADNLHTSEAEYMKIIYNKTAILFAAATEVGAILANKENYREAFKNYGLNLGLAFQIMDDILDYKGDSQNLGKNTGDDFREGKITLPIILSYKNGDTQIRSFWEKTFNNNIKDTESLQQALTILKNGKILEQCKEKAIQHVILAKESLQILPENPYKVALLETVDFCLNRIK
ncbi:polyprenyl synthetase family protein [Bartonella sp. DGB1]|uniref:polyprenyl synthetase family protein n=1 Tax=Bartonella sp. DGB1 TaxID=3239807 RepID=UPI003525EC84